MPEYEFECRNCKKIFRLFMRISERASGGIRCPGCGSEDVEALMHPFVARTAGTGGIADALKAVEANLRKETGAEVVYEADPKHLVDRLLHHYGSPGYNCPCHPRGDSAR